MKRKSLNIILIIIFIIGILIMLYPFISQSWNKKVHSKVIKDYDKIVENIKDEDYEQMFKKASEYNKKLSMLSFPLVEYKKLKNYHDLLNIRNNGMMGYITIDKINVSVPIYHSVKASVLNESVGHMEGSSLPIGTNNSHSILSAHSGLSTKRLFTDLNKLEIGDIFVINVLNKELTYQVDKIVIVSPSDISHLEIENNKDYVTLITCTPYGINTHRLLVRGVRIENILEKKIIVTNEADLIDRLIVSLIIAIPILFIIFLVSILKPIKKEVNIC